MPTNYGARKTAASPGDLVAPDKLISATSSSIVLARTYWGFKAC